MTAKRLTLIINVLWILIAVVTSTLNRASLNEQVVINDKAQLSNQDGNPFLYPCTTNNDCNNEFRTCAKDGPNSTYWFCACYCGGGPCRQNEDCCTNICENGICATSGGTQGCVCSGTTSECPAGEQCANGYVCQQWGKYGYCNSISPITVSTSEAPTTISTTTSFSVPGNPYLYPCVSSDQCSNYLHYCMVGGPNSSYSFCDCSCNGACIQNEDCCTNICNNNVCSSTGGTQGCFCTTNTDVCGATDRCASGYTCEPWGPYGYGYCNYNAPMSTSTATEKSTAKPDNNPYLYPCTTDSQCNNYYHKCVIGFNSSNSFCQCGCGYSYCVINEDCCTNICDRGACTLIGGTQGAVCKYPGCGDTDQCAPGYICVEFEQYGYCDSISFDCSQKPNGNYSDEAISCAKTFYTCTNGVTTVQHCEDNFVFNPSTSECIGKSGVPDCTPN